jgi:hypothetical protein
MTRAAELAILETLATMTPDPSKADVFHFHAETCVLCQLNEPCTEGLELVTTHAVEVAPERRS